MTDNPHLTRRWSFGRVREGLPTIRELRVLVSLTIATNVDDVTDQLLVDVFLGVAGEGSVANHSGSGRTPTCRSAATLLSLLRPRLLPEVRHEFVTNLGSLLLVSS